MENYDLIVIGGGPAGYNGAERAAGTGLKVLLIEKEDLGGTCLNRGCIPTKTFLYSGKIYHYVKGDCERYGVKYDNPEVKHKAIVAKKDQVVKTLVGGIGAAMKRKKIKVVYGTAKLGDKKDGVFRVTVDDEKYTGKSLLIATGSAPVIPKIPGVDEEIVKGTVVTSTEVLMLEEVPEKLVIIGGGVIGFEMAAYFQMMGSQVTVMEMLDKVLGNNDREISAIIQKQMEQKGIRFFLNSKVCEIKNGVCKFVKDGEEISINYDKVLLSVGRKPVTDLEGLEQLGVKIQKGAIVTDDECHTTAEGIYAAGDVNGKITLAHVGYREAEVAVNNILGKKDRMDYSAIAGVVYTHPEAAFVGLNEEQAKEAGIDIEVKKVSINFSGRHVVENGMSDGICKIVIDKKKEIIIGASLLCSYASEIIYSLALMIQNKIPVESIVRTVFPHPTVCEIIREALMD
ncbi:dihydrolipoyl dehydrogenase [Petroclostridium sp. X23]|uniref:dihydrolipoyl dehydrogenase n=1 Tax=Petroclostridium sp. X23 TaxID=3045146 RepID=UPI0024AD9B18|nr:dihydrolipoyl dehydrogenase [Petroclostridium sp. X23]WHH57030.1 dihydrolipoyl dehydrogenase [Petroclostridium sp. X23]